MPLQTSFFVIRPWIMYTDTSIETDLFSSPSVAVAAVAGEGVVIRGGDGKEMVGVAGDARPNNPAKGFNRGVPSTGRVAGLCSG